MRLSLYCFLIFLLFSQITYGQYPGCTDPDAWNYADFAEVDDGSCVFVSECGEGMVWRALSMYLPSEYMGTMMYVVSVNEQDTLLAEEYTSVLGWQYMGFCMPVNSCFYFDVYFESIPYPDFSGGQIQLFNSTPLYNGFGPNALIGELYHGPGAHYRISFNADNEGCEYTGCTDPLAENYWPWAVVDYGCVYCEGSQVTVSEEVVLGGDKDWGIFQGENYIDGGSFGGQYDEPIEIVCLADGCYHLKVFGDKGWKYDKIHLEFPEGDTLASMFLSAEGIAEFPIGINAEDCATAGEIYGCTNPLAINYNSSATIDNGSCDLLNDNCSISFSIELDTIANTMLFIPDINTVEYPFYMMWDFGDGTEISDEWWTSHEYTTEGPYNVCVTLYSFAFSDLEPHCYDTYCIWLDPADYGLSGLIGFIVNQPGETDGIDENIVSKAISLYPNPTRNQLNCSLTDSNVQFEAARIYSTEGRFIRKVDQNFSKSENLQIDVSALPAGSYFIVFDNSEVRAIKRFVKD